MPRFNIYYRKFSMLARDYIDYIKVVETEDIYHEIGKIICKSIEHIERISYTQPKASQEECEQFWLENGYEKVLENLWARRT